MIYFADMGVSLYTPDYEIENDPLCTNNMLCTSTLKDAYVIMNTETTNHLAFFANNMEDLVFNLPFLTEDGEVRKIFRNGAFARLYYRLKSAADNGKIDMERFKKFQSQISTIRDTLSLSNIATEPLPYILTGVSLISWDAEQNSSYVKTSLHDATFSRRSNIYTSALEIVDLLQEWYKEGLLTDEDYRELEAIRTQKNGAIKNCSGWTNIQYVNYHLNLNMHIEQADGLLDNLVTALYGKDSGKELWLVINFSSNYMKGNGFHEVE